MERVLSLNMSELQQLLTAAAKAGAAEVVATLRPAEDLITQNQAWKEYGRRVVENFVERGMLVPKRTGTTANSKRMYSRADLIRLTQGADLSAMVKIGKRQREKMAQLLQGK